MRVIISIERRLDISAAPVQVVITDPVTKHYVPDYIEAGADGSVELDEVLGSLHNSAHVLAASLERLKK